MSNPVNGTINRFFIDGGVGAGSARLGQTVVPATINVADPAGLTDGFGAMLSIDATGRLRVQLGATPVPVQPPAAALVDGLGATARVVAPGAGAPIVTVAAPPAGTYDVQVRAAFDAGAPAAGDINNMELREGATVRTSLQVLPVIASYPGVVVFRLNLDGATAVSVNATGAGTAGVGYNAQLSLIRVA